MTIKKPHGNIKHGRWKDPSFKAYQNLLRALTNTKCRSYQSHGAKGHTMCERWLNYSEFLKDMGLRPKGKILRLKEGQTEFNPVNSYWGYQERERVFSAFNETDTLPKLLCRHGAKGLTIGTLRYRLYRGMDIEKALSTPPGKTNNPSGISKNPKQEPKEKAPKFLINSHYELS